MFDHSDTQQPEGGTLAIPETTSSAQEPYTIRLPKTGEYCRYSGLSRSGVNQIILPCEANDFKPPVKSFRLAREGNIKGIRLIVWASLKAYLKQQEEGAAK